MWRTSFLKVLLFLALSSDEVSPSGVSCSRASRRLTFKIGENSPASAWGVELHKTSTDRSWTAGLADTYPSPSATATTSSMYSVSWNFSACGFPEYRRVCTWGLGTLHCLSSNQVQNDHWLDTGRNRFGEAGDDVPKWFSTLLISRRHSSQALYTRQSKQVNRLSAGAALCWRFDLTHSSVGSTFSLELNMAKKIYRE